MARKESIPQNVREQVVGIVERFNTEYLPPVARQRSSWLQSLFRRSDSKTADEAPPPGHYVPRFRGRYVYLDRVGFGGSLSQICRLTWTGRMNRWEFAIYKHSSNRYDPDEWFFPGIEEVDGTIEGAMRAGLEAYPV